MLLNTLEHNTLEKTEHTLEHNTLEKTEHTLEHTLEQLNKKRKSIQILTRNNNKKKRSIMKNNLYQMENDYKELIYTINKWFNITDISLFFSKIQTISKQLSEYIINAIEINSYSDMCNYNNLYNILSKSKYKESLSELLILKKDLQQYFNCNSRCSNIDYPFILINDITSLKIKVNKLLKQLLQTSILLYNFALQSQKTWEPNKLKLKYYINDCCKYLFKLQKLHYKIDNLIKHIGNFCDL